MTPRCRYAPSPTGALHVGNLRTALLSWLHARALGAAFVLRMEDLDAPRVVPGAAERILEDLRWLGIDWDEGRDVGGRLGPYAQSERTALYERALDKLRSAGHVFACTCSRAEIRRASSAPHGPEDDGPRYPGTCRAGVSNQERPSSMRFRVRTGEVRFIDGFRGPIAIDVGATVGDFVVKRADGLFAYQLAVAVDDAAMGVTHVVRGEDLLSSTPRQIVILRALGEPAPEYAHVPLVVGPDGARLAKRAGGTTVAELRRRGVTPERLCGYLAHLAGLAKRGAKLRPRDLVDGFSLTRVARSPARFDPRAL